MELPQQLRRAVERALEGVALGELAKTAAALSQRYRQERHDGSLPLASRDDALAYLAVRLPATYAAVRASLDAVAQARPDFAPKSLLDLGAGPATALWAAVDRWTSLKEAMLVEASPAFRACGEQLMRDARLPPAVWRGDDIRKARLEGAPRDLAVLAYVLNELEPKARNTVLEEAWRMTGGILLLVEPGTPDGFRVDVDGNLWCGWGMGSAELDGVMIFNPDGKPIGRIAVPERCANLAFGGTYRNRLFMAGSTSLYSLYVNTQGAAGG